MTIKRLKILVVVLGIVAIGLVITFAVLSSKSDKLTDEKDYLTTEDIEKPADVEEPVITMEGVTYTVPEGFGSLASDNIEYSENYYENKDGLGINIMHIGSNQFGDFNATSAKGVIKTVESENDIVKDFTVDGKAGKIMTTKDKGNVVQMTLAFEASNDAYLVVLFGEKDGEFVIIDKEMQKTFEEFCNSIVINE